MAEELKLKFSVDKDGVISVEQLASAFKKVDKEVTGIGGNLGAMKASWDKAMNVAAIGIISGAVVGVYSAVRNLATGLVDAAKEGEGLNKTALALDRALVQAGINAGEFRKELKTATGGESSIADLDRITFKLQEMGYEWEQIPAFMAAAKSAADIRGQDVATTTETLGRALAAGSEKGLKPYGILLDKVGLLADAARKAGVPVAALTEKQEQAAYIAEGFAQFTGRASDAVNGLGSSAERTEARMRDAFDGIKKLFAGGMPSLFTGATIDALSKDNLQEQLEGARKAVEEIDNLKTEAAPTWGFGGMSGYAPGAMEKALETARQLTAVQDELFRAIADNVKGSASEAGEAASKIERMNLRQEAAKASTDAWIESLENQSVELYKNGYALEGFLETLDINSPALTKAIELSRQNAERLVAQTEKLKELRAAYKDPTIIVSLQAQLRAAELAGQGQEEFAVRLRESVQVAKEAAKPLDDLTNKLTAMLAASGSLKSAQELLPGADTATLAMIAGGMDDVAEAKSNLDKAMDSASYAKQFEAFAELQQATADYAKMLGNVGLETSVATKATADLEASMQLLRSQVIEGKYEWAMWGEAAVGAATGAINALGNLPKNTLGKLLDMAKGDKKPEAKGGTKTSDEDPYLKALAADAEARNRLDEEAETRRIEAEKEGNEILLAMNEQWSEARAARQADEIAGMAAIQAAMIAYQVEIGAITRDEAELLALQERAADASLSKWDREVAGIQAAAAEYRNYQNQVSEFADQLEGGFGTLEHAAAVAGEAGVGYGRQMQHSFGLAGKASSIFAKGYAAQGGKQRELMGEGMAASTELAASFISDEQDKFLVLGGGEAAASLAAFSNGNIPGGVGHAAASAMYFTLAGSAGGGGGGSKAGFTGQTSSLGTSAPVAQNSGPSNLYVTIQGAVYGQASEAGEKIAGSLEAYARSGGRMSSRIMGR